MPLKNGTAVAFGTAGNVVQLATASLSLVAGVTMLLLFAVLPKLRRGPLSAIMYSAFCDVGWSIFCMFGPLCSLLDGDCAVALDGVPCELFGFMGTFFGLALFNWYGVICFNVLLTVSEWRCVDAVVAMRRLTIKRWCCCAPGSWTGGESDWTTLARSLRAPSIDAQGRSLSPARRSKICCGRRGKRIHGRCRRGWNACELRDASSGDVNVLAALRHVYAWLPAAVLSVALLAAPYAVANITFVFGPTAEFAGDEECWITNQMKTFRMVLYGPMMIYVVFACCVLATAVCNCRSLPRRARGRTLCRMLAFVLTFAALWSIPFIDRVVGLLHPSKDSPEWLQILKNVAIAGSGLANFCVWASSGDIRRKVLEELRLPHCPCDVLGAGGAVGAGAADAGAAGGDGRQRRVSSEVQLGPAKLRERDAMCAAAHALAPGWRDGGDDSGGNGGGTGDSVADHAADDADESDEESEDMHFAWRDSTDMLHLAGLGADGEIAPEVAGRRASVVGWAHCVRHVRRELRFCCCCLCEDLLLCDIAAAEEYADSGTVLSKTLIRLPSSQSYTWGRTERFSEQLA
jgi:hypothetical protein